MFLFHSRINPQNEAAKKGLERLEKQMKVCRFFFLILKGEKQMKILLLSSREWTQMHQKRMKTMMSKMLKEIKKMLEFLNIAKHFDLQHM